MPDGRTAGWTAEWTASALRFHRCIDHMQFRDKRPLAQTPAASAVVSRVGVGVRCSAIFGEGSVGAFDRRKRAGAVMTAPRARSERDGRLAQRGSPGPNERANIERWRGMGRAKCLRKERRVPVLRQSCGDGPSAASFRYAPKQAPAAIMHNALCDASMERIQHGDHLFYPLPDRPIPARSL